MKKLIATFGWLMMATASMGEAGQHTGVGGNPYIPPPTPSSVVIPIIVIESIFQPAGIIIIPDQTVPENQDGTADDGSNEDQEDKSDK